MAGSSTRRTNAAAVSGDRGSLRRLLDVRGRVPGFGVPYSDCTLVTADGVRLSASYLPPATGCGRNPPRNAPAVVVVHGFAGHRRKPAYAYLAERLTEVGAVLAVDLRGHGDSGGASTLGLDEALDVRAAVSELRRLGHHWIAVVGASMGAAAAVRAAGLVPGGEIDAVCAISAPAHWGLAGSPAMRRLTKIAVSAPRRRAVEIACGLRIASGAWPAPPGSARGGLDCADPASAVVGISPAPLLIVHGADDHYFGVEQAEALYAAARPPRTLWIEPPGFGHAEDGLRPLFVSRLLAGLVAVVAGRRWPSRSAAAVACGQTGGGEAMAVQVRMFAALREAAGDDRVEVAPGRLDDVLAGLAQRYGERFERVLASSTVLVDGSAVGRGDRRHVADGSEVALLPPVSGGGR